MGFFPVMFFWLFRSCSGKMRESTNESTNGSLCGIRLKLKQRDRYELKVCSRAVPIHLHARFCACSNLQILFVPTSCKRFGYGVAPSLKIDQILQFGISKSLVPKMIHFWTTGWTYGAHLSEQSRCSCTRLCPSSKIRRIVAGFWPWHGSLPSFAQPLPWPW